MKAGIPANATRKMVPQAALKQAGGLKVCVELGWEENEVVLLVQAVLCRVVECNSPRLSVTFDNIRGETNASAGICTGTLLYVACLIFLKSSLPSKAVDVVHISFSF